MSRPKMTKQQQTRTTLIRLAWAVPAAVVALLVVVLLARLLRDQPAVSAFVADYPGTLEPPERAPVGLPAWLGWQHFLNAFFLLLIVRTGWLQRTTVRPRGHWTRNNRGLLRTTNPPKRISLNLWLHLALDALWVLNGLVFAVLILATGHWARIVPTSWEVFPHALSVLLQYASLDWPMENGWVAYNALQVLAYFVTVFVAAPLAIVTGLRLSPAWPRNEAVNRAYPLSTARSLHLAVMAYYVAFTVVHVTLVLATGALRNLNHMYAARDEVSWVGFWIFAASVVVMVVGWVLARPVFVQPVAALTGKVTR